MYDMNILPHTIHTYVNYAGLRNLVASVYFKFSLIQHISKIKKRKKEKKGKTFPLPQRQIGKQPNYLN